MKIPKARKLPSGKYFIQLRIKLPDGSTQSISITENTEKLCIAKAAAIKGGLIERKTSGNETLNDAINNYIRRRTNVLSPATIRGYKIIQNNRFVRYINTPLKNISEKTMQDMINEEAKFVSGKTLKNAWGFIASVLRESTGKEYNVKLPQMIPKEQPFLDYEQIQAFLSIINGDKQEIPALLALCSLRKSEILALDWKNVDLKNNVIYVRGAMVPDENNIFVDKETNKNSSSRRTVPIVIPRLAALLASVPDKTGKVYKGTESAPKKRIDRVCINNGLPPVGLHGLRRSFASLCYHLRISELECMRIGGWSDWGTMRKVYTKLAEADKKEAENKLFAFFANQQND